MRNWKSARMIIRNDHAETAARYGAAACFAHRADMLDALAAQIPPGVVTLGARCTEVRTDGDVAYARFRDGSEVEADVVVGADGIHSAVRASLFGEDAPRFTGKICYRGLVPVDAVPGGAARPRVGDVARAARRRRRVRGAPRRTDQRRQPLRRRDLRARVVDHRVRPRRGARALRGWHESLRAALLRERHLVQVGALRPRPDPAVDQRTRHGARRRRAPDAALPRPGRVPGGRGRMRACGRARRHARRPPRGARALRPRTPAAGQRRRARRPRARRREPPHLAAGGAQARRADRHPQALRRRAARRAAAAGSGSTTPGSPEALAA